MVPNERGCRSSAGTEPKNKNECAARNLGMSSDQKDCLYWTDKITFLESHLNDSPGEIDKDNRVACEDALKAAKVNLVFSRWEQVVNPWSVML